MGESMTVERIEVGYDMIKSMSTSLCDTPVGGRSLCLATLGWFIVCKEDYVFKV